MHENDDEDLSSNIWTLVLGGFIVAALLLTISNKSSISFLTTPPPIPPPPYEPPPLNLAIVLGDVGVISQYCMLTGKHTITIKPTLVGKAAWQKAEIMWLASDKGLDTIRTPLPIRVNRFRELVGFKLRNKDGIGTDADLSEPHHLERGVHYEITLISTNLTPAHFLLKIEENGCAFYAPLAPPPSLAKAPDSARKS